MEKINVREKLKDHYDSLAEDLPPDIVEKEIKKDERLLEIVDERARNRASEVSMKVDKDQFDKDLHDTYPDWQQIWHTPEFQAFLAEEDGISGFKRYDVISSAFQRCDSRTIIRAFDAFSGRSKTRSSQSGTRTMSVMEARKALKDLAIGKARGEWKGREKEYSAKEKELWAVIDGE